MVCSYWEYKSLTNDSWRAPSQIRVYNVTVRENPVVSFQRWAKYRDLDGERWLNLLHRGARGSLGLFFNKVND